MTDDISKVKPAPNWCPACRQRPDALTLCAHPFHRIESAHLPNPCEIGSKSVDAAAPVEVEGGMLPDALGPHAEEWYRLCERRFAVDRIGISGPLAEAIVTAIDTLARQLAEAKNEAEKWRTAEGRAVSELQRELHNSNLALREATRRVARAEAERDELRQAAHGLRFDVFSLTTNELQATFDGKQSIAVVDMDTVAALKSALQKEPK